MSHVRLIRINVALTGFSTIYYVQMDSGNVVVLITVKCQARLVMQVNKSLDCTD